MLAAAMLFAVATATFQPVTAATTAQTQQVYVRDPSAQADPGEGGHAFGYRTPSDNDPDGLPLFNSRGDALRAALGVWRTATGTATFDRVPEGTKVQASFRGLLPNGRYSLFVRQLAGRIGTVFSPLDVQGTTNNFTADATGRGQIVVNAPVQLQPSSQLVLVYHSDGSDHGSSIGVLGVNAHPQLITRIP